MSQSFLWIPSLRSFHIYDPTHPPSAPCIAIPIESSSPAHWHSDHSLELGGGVAQGQLNSDPTLLSVLRVWRGSWSFSSEMMERLERRARSGIGCMLAQASQPAGGKSKKE